jgi:hypothetical protein
MFLKSMEGTLMELTESAETRYRFVVWFDYTRQAINEIQEGTLLAVPNFGGNSDVRRYSVLEVATILPTHYALHTGSGGFPGFVVEAARSAAEDWETQDTESSEDTTKIRVVAIPTNLEIIEPINSDPSVGLETNIPMVGSRVRILDTRYTNLIANNGIDKEHEKNLTIIGTMIRDADVKILLRIEELYRTHFAIFGFTGVGKSNLLSTVVAKVMTDATEPLKLVFFDLMSEYTALLVDQLLDPNINGRILTIGRHTLPEGLYKHINQHAGAPSLDDAARQLIRYTLLPKALQKDKAKISYAIRDLVGQAKLHVYADAKSLSVFDLFFSAQTPWGKERRGANIAKRGDLAKAVLRATMQGRDYKQTTFDPALAKSIRKGIEEALARDGTFAEDFAPIINKLEELEHTSGEVLAAGVTLEDLVTDLNDHTRKSLWVIQSHNPNELRAFSKRLGDAIYEKRRQDGLIDPLVSFIFDEADEFVRSETGGTYGESREIAETLARRGRKFGLGLGIATQRIRYLDTSIMAQPHTYFISKLPRLSDRQAVSEAFGVSEEMLNQTFKFKKGNWLLMSHDATGLEAIPVPIKTPDANQRLSDWLHEHYGRM